MYLTSSLGSNTTQLQQIRAQQHQQQQQQQQHTDQKDDKAVCTNADGGVQVLATLAASDNCDVGTVLVDALEKVPQAAGFNYLRNTWKVGSVGL